MCLTSAKATELLDALDGGVVLLNRDLTIDFVNGSAERLLRNTRAQLRGRPLASVLRDSDALINLCKRCILEHNTLVVREFSVHPIYDSGDQTLRADVVASPYGDQHLLLEWRDNEQQLRIDKENRLLEQRGVGRTMASQLAHEIKNPLGGLRGAAQLLAKRLDDPALTAFTDVIIRESDRLVGLVDRMLGPSGPDRFAETNIHRVLQHVKQLVAAEAGEVVNLIEDYDPSLPDISIDEDRVIQAVLNVMRNALQAIDGAGTITLRTRAINGFTIADHRHGLVLRIDIVDSGPGIDDAIKERLFFPLVTGRDSGTGLGLTVAQDLVSRHGGLIKITGSNPTVFSLYFPYLRRATNSGVQTT